MKSLTLTLYLLNLLPLPHLDGSQFLDALLDMYFSASPPTTLPKFSLRPDPTGLDRRDIEMEAGEAYDKRGNGRKGGMSRQKERVSQVIKAMTIGLVGGSVGLGVLKGLIAWWG